MTEDAELPSWKKRDGRGQKMSEFIKELQPHKPSPKTPVSKTPKSTSRTSLKSSKTPVKAPIPSPEVVVKTPKTSPKAQKIRTPTPRSLTPEEPSELLQATPEESRILRRMNMGPKGFKRRGRPRQEDYDEREKNMELVQQIKEGKVEIDVIKPPPAKKPRKAISPKPKIEPPAIVSSIPVTRKQARIMQSTSTLTPCQSSNVISPLPPIQVHTQLQFRPAPPMSMTLPKIVHPLPTHSNFPNKFNMKPPPSLNAIRFIKPKLHSIYPQSPATNMSLLKDALFIRKPHSTATNSFNGKVFEKENYKVPQVIQTNMHSDYQLRHPPSLITFANYPNSSLSFEPNVKYCLVSQNGELIYPASELEKNAVPEPEPSPTHRFFEPHPNYFLTVL